MNQNFGLPFPMYQGMVPNMMNTMPSPTVISTDCSNNNDMGNIESRLDNLERRINNIENYINNSNMNNNYNSNNYQML